MQGVCLRIYIIERQKHHGEMLYEWLLERAKALGILGGSVFRATAGFGRHGRIHEEAFFELAADLPMELEFVLSEQQATQILKLLKDEHLQLFYLKLPAEYGVIGVDV